MGFESLFRVEFCRYLTLVFEFVDSFVLPCFGSIAIFFLLRLGFLFWWPWGAPGVFYWINSVCSPNVWRTWHRPRSRILGLACQLALFLVSESSCLLVSFGQSVSTGVSNASSASQNVTTGSGGATGSADMRAPASTERKDEKTSASNSAATGSEAKPLKPPALSLDALAKAKKTLQMQKELAEKMKKLPQVFHCILSIAWFCVYMFPYKNFVAWLLFRD